MKPRKRLLDLDGIRATVFVCLCDSIGGVGLVESYASDVFRQETSLYTTQARAAGQSARPALTGPRQSTYRRRSACTAASDQRPFLSCIYCRQHRPLSTTASVVQHRTEISLIPTRKQVAMLTVRSRSHRRVLPPRESLLSISTSKHARACPSISPQNCPFSWGIRAPSKTWFFAFPSAHIPNGISIGSSVFHIIRS